MAYQHSLNSEAGSEDTPEDLTYFSLGQSLTTKGQTEGNTFTSIILTTRTLVETLEAFYERSMGVGEFRSGVSLFCWSHILCWMLRKKENGAFLGDSSRGPDGVRTQNFGWFYRRES